MRDITKDETAFVVVVAVNCGRKCEAKSGKAKSAAGMPAMRQDFHSQDKRHDLLFKNLSTESGMASEEETA
ncbi:MAG: hypothetical protein IJP68_05870 [Selenomonadaceae bacterium]|nr:hypothetical protein [Selenomonadaceae bacterium]